MSQNKRRLPRLGQAIGFATPPGKWSVVGPPRRRKGPAPGTVDRYGPSDRKLYPELERIMRERQKSATAAARQLVEDGYVTGVGAPESRARRLAKRYLDDSR
jgi:hypothetical protein